LLTEKEERKAIGKGNKNDKKREGEIKGGGTDKAREIDLCRWIESAWDERASDVSVDAEV
jgi:hypothetical protein